jgi:hypothetical protein
MNDKYTGKALRKGMKAIKQGEISCFSVQIIGVVCLVSYVLILAINQLPR